MSDELLSNELIPVPLIISKHLGAKPFFSPLVSGSYGEAGMGGGYTQSPGGFGSPAASQGGEKKGVSVFCLFILLTYLFDLMF